MYWEELDISCLEALYKLSRIGAVASIAILVHPVTKQGWAYLEREEEGISTPPHPRFVIYAPILSCTGPVK